MIFQLPNKNSMATTKWKTIYERKTKFKKRRQKQMDGKFRGKWAKKLKCIS